MEWVKKLHGKTVALDTSPLMRHGCSQRDVDPWNKRGRFSFPIERSQSRPNQTEGCRPPPGSDKITMDLMKEIASDEVLKEAYQWLCERRKDYSANSDVWDVRWRWNEIKSWLKEQLLAGSYHFDALLSMLMRIDPVSI